MKVRKLNYRFHNPNPAATTANYLLEILMEANREKIQLAIQAADKQNHALAEDREGHPA